MADEGHEDDEQQLERCWAVLGGAELSGHRLSAPAVAEPVGQLRGLGRPGISGLVYRWVPAWRYTLEPSRRRGTPGSSGSSSAVAGWATLCGGRSAASVIRCASPSTAACPVARMRRWASAATLVGACAASRLAEIVAITAAAGASTHAPVTSTLHRTCLFDRQSVSIAVRLSSPPRHATASVRHCWRCSSCERSSSSCLASRVVRLARRQVGSTTKCDGFGGGGFAAVIGHEFLGQHLILVVDLRTPRGPQHDQLRGHPDDLADLPFTGVGVPALSETQPQLPAALGLTRVLYNSEAVTFAAYNGRPSRECQRHTPSRPQARTLFDTTTWVRRPGSPARVSRWVNDA